jgi:ABC-type branched-subunit amino acid transport system substrate-binding protein
LSRTREFVFTPETDMAMHDRPLPPPTSLVTRLLGCSAGRLACLALGGLGAAALGTASLGGCSLVLGFEECTTNSDCDFGAGGRCENGRCVADNTTGDGDGDPTGDGDGDPTGDGDGDPTGDGDGDGDPTACTTNTECVDAHTATWLCGSEGTCMNGITSECQLLVWPNNTPQDKVVFVGSIMPTSPPFTDLILPVQNAMQLAVEDFNKEATLPNGERLAWIACDSKGSVELAKLAAQHLVDVGVPAIVGPVFSETALAVANDIAIPNGVFMITPTATNKAITTLADNDLVWRTIASDVYQANAMGDRLNAIASQQSTVILYKNDAYGSDLAADTYARLSGGLASATKTYAYSVFADQAQLLDEIASVLGPVIANDQPQTVVILGTSEATAIILSYLQAAAQIDPQLIPQRFIMSHGAVPSMPVTIQAAPNDQTRQLLYTIMEGVAPIIFDQNNFAAFNIRYKIKFNDEDAITTSSLSYDSLLVAAFAMAAIPEGEAITGANMAAQMSRLVDTDGTFINFSGGTSFISQAVNALSTGGSVDLQGVSGGLDFDLETGDVRTNLLGWEAEPIGGNLSTPTLAPQRMYILDDEPATDGMWIDL